MANDQVTKTTHRQLGGHSKIFSAGLDNRHEAALTEHVPQRGLRSGWGWCTSALTLIRNLQLVYMHY
jgi:hypothetical protein